jgi:predicted PurR-regulated permease PerM
MALLSAVATAILAVIIISMLYFGRDIFVPVALAILLSFVLAPLVGILQRIHVPRGLAVVSVVILAFSLIFAMGSLLATQLTQLAGDLPRYQSTISEKIQSFRDTKAGRGTLERASDMLKDLSTLELLREGAKADLVAASLGEAVKLCIEATGVKDQEASKQEMSAAVAA